MWARGGERVADIRDHLVCECRSGSRAGTRADEEVSWGFNFALTDLTTCYFVRLTESGVTGDKDAGDDSREKSRVNLEVKTRDGWQEPGRRKESVLGMIKDMTTHRMPFEVYYRKPERASRRYAKSQGSRKGNLKEWG